MPLLIHWVAVPELRWLQMLSFRDVLEIPLTDEQIKNPEEPSGRGAVDFLFNFRFFFLVCLSLKC